MSARAGGGADLPWGWWLRGNGRSFEDASGRRWASVRAAFWHGELGFPEIHFAAEQQERFLRTLTGVDSQWFNVVDGTHDLFDGDMAHWRFYMCWLSSIGMLDPSRDGSPLKATLSDRGRSVMLMLRATRNPEWVDLPMTDVVDAVRTSRRGPADHDRERAFGALEREVARRRHVFARERVGRTHLVTLTGISTGARMPTRRVIWSQSFADEDARDDLFAWLAERVDRWDDWGVLAYGKGAAALTQHLLKLLVVRLAAFGPERSVGARG